MQMPSRIMVLDFPRTVGLQNLRSSIRIETDINAKVKDRSKLLANNNNESYQLMAASLILLMVRS